MIERNTSDSTVEPPRRSGINKQLVFMGIMIFLGVLTASLITAVLGAIAIPTFDTTLLTLPEYQDFERMRIAFGMLEKNADPLLVLGFLLMTGALILLLNVLNPGINPKNMRTGKAIGKVVVIVLAVLSLGALYGFLNDATEGIGWQIVFAPVVFCVVWLVAGETGWGGDLTSWRYEHRGGGPGISGTMVMGALWGVAAGLFGVFLNQAFGKYFILVSEVLDGSGETTLTGFLQLFAGGAVLISLAGGILIGLVFPLAPVRTDPNTRKQLLLAPGILVLILLLIVGGGNLYAVSRHDLGVKSLAEAASLGNDVPEAMTLVNLSAVKASELVAQEWPMEVQIWGMAYSGTITVSDSNLENLDEFLEKKRGLSIYQYPAMDARLKGSFALFDVPGAEEQLNAYSRELILPRMIQLYRLRFLPVTPENRAILLGYADEKVWHVPGKAAFTLARAFDHFGMPEEARKWLERARNEEVDTEDFRPAEEPALTGGWISGTFAVEGAQPSEAVVGLMRYQKLGDSITIMRLQMDLLAAVHPDDNGSFTFRDLGSGEYRLVALLPEQLDSSAIEVTGGTGIIELSRETQEIDLGRIEIAYQ